LIFKLKAYVLIHLEGHLKELMAMMVELCCPDMEKDIDIMSSLRRIGEKCKFFRNHLIACVHSSRMRQQKYAANVYSIMRRLISVLANFGDHIHYGHTIIIDRDVLRTPTINVSFDWNMHHIPFPYPIHQ
jgi:hypothetical protein